MAECQEAPVARQVGGGVSAVGCRLPRPTGYFPPAEPKVRLEQSSDPPYKGKVMKAAEDMPLIPSATVVLVRPFQDRFQVYLIRRSRNSGFMGGLYVFPGGLVDPQDRDEAFWRSRVDLTPDRVELRLGGGLSTQEATAYGIAAIRETAEESGVMLAFGKGDSDGAAARFSRPTPDAARRSGWMADEARKSGWTLALSSLLRWSRWITPIGMKKRFDTRFFLALMPEGQSCSPDEHETIQGRWATPREGLAANLAGKIPLSPPTVVTLHQLLAFDTLAGLLADARRRSWGGAIRPRMIPLDRGAVIVEPWDPMYAAERIEIDPDTLEAKVADAGAPFSRIWIHRGRCLPIAPG
jgi:hypothetical protein